jgi:hypothetical protein
VDNAIYENHGFKCFADGNVENDSPGNTYYLHVCDIFNMMHHTSNVGIWFPMVVIITTMLKSIYVDTRDELSSVLLNEEQKKIY